MAGLRGKAYGQDLRDWVPGHYKEQDNRGFSVSGDAEAAACGSIAGGRRAAAFEGASTPGPSALTRSPELAAISLEHGRDCRTAVVVVDVPAIRRTSVSNKRNGTPARFSLMGLQEPMLGEAPLLAARGMGAHGHRPGRRRRAGAQETVPSTRASGSCWGRRRRPGPAACRHGGKTGVIRRATHRRLPPLQDAACQSSRPRTPTHTQPRLAGRS